MYVPHLALNFLGIGVQIAMTELRTVLCMLVKKYEWRLPDTKDGIHPLRVPMTPAGLLGPRDLELIWNRVD